LRRQICEVHQPEGKLFVIRELSEQVQTELANANSVADEVLANMPTVRAHAAEDTCHTRFCPCHGT
jgi:ABC-type multidrug transport system fused ATPase/permease subunit